MKKRKLFLGLLLMTGLSNAYSQSYKNAFAVNLGVTQDGIGAMISHNYFIKRHDYIEASILITDSKYRYKEGSKVPYNNFTLNTGYSKNLFSNKKNSLSANIGAGGVLGYESINNDKNLSDGSLILASSKLIYGAYVGLDIDYVLNDKLSLFLKVNEYYHANSDLGKFVPFAGLGLRYYAN